MKAFVRWLQSVMISLYTEQVGTHSGPRPVGPVSIFTSILNLATHLEIAPEIAGRQRESSRRTLRPVTVSAMEI